jgi:phosphatidylinositol glycan class W
VHEAALVRGGLAEYVLHAPRETLVAANKEGLASLPGYLALSMLGQGLGRYLLQPRPAPPGGWSRVPAALVAIAAAAFAAVWALAPVSRRMANAAYVAWVLGASSLALAMLVAAAVALPTATATARGLVLVRAINANQLPLFLLVGLNHPSHIYCRDEDNTAI